MKKIKKVALTVAVMSLFLAPVAAPIFALGSNDLGVEYGQDTGLGSADVRSTISNVINVMLGLLGIVALVIVIAGGVIWMTSQGDTEKVERAKGLMGAGAIGLLIILSAYAITRFVINAAIEGTTGV